MSTEPDDMPEHIRLGADVLAAYHHQIACHIWPNMGELAVTIVVRDPENPSRRGWVLSNETDLNQPVEEIRRVQTSEAKPGPSGKPS